MPGRIHLRAQRHLDGEADKSGSTIHQQVVKNLLLTPSMSWYRKGLEDGLQPVRELGIDGFAEPAADAPDSCQTMPPAVAERIEQEGTR